MADKIVAIFAEGATDIEFYKAVINKARTFKKSPFDCKIKYKDIKGIGNFKNNALRVFKNLKTNNKGMDIYVFLCIDSDVFEYSKKPPIIKNDVKKALLDAGAKKVEYLVAQKSIEDLFLFDLKGVLKYLGLPQSTKCPHKNSGQESLKILFSKANKVYVKGEKTDGLIEKLEITKILDKGCSTFKPLCKTLNLDCRSICKKN